VPPATGTPHTPASCNALTGWRRAGQGGRDYPEHLGAACLRELLATLRSFARLNLVGADTVEVAPAYDHAQITGIAAAHAGYEILSALAASKAAA
jgi:hypothetical protein